MADAPAKVDGHHIQLESNEAIEPSNVYGLVWRIDRYNINADSILQSVHSGLDLPAQ